MEEKELVRPFKIENEAAKPLFSIAEKQPDPETIEYLFLYEAVYDEDEVKSFEFITGRKELINFIKNIADFLTIEQCKVLSAERLVKDGLDLKVFMMVFRDQFNDGLFDIFDYITEEEGDLEDGKEQ